MLIYVWFAQIFLSKRAYRNAVSRKLYIYLNFGVALHCLHCLMMINLPEIMPTGIKMAHLSRWLVQKCCLRVTPLPMYGDGNPLYQILNSLSEQGLFLVGSLPNVVVFRNLNFEEEERNTETWDTTLTSETCPFNLFVGLCPCSWYLSTLC